ncbi:MAG TPA: secretion protein [Oceanospirillaceae bacterium]|nr:secretion protein [Oceanospirillaceae bacterium]
MQGIAPDFSGISASHIDFVRVEQGLYEQRKYSLDGEIDTLNANLALAKEELNMNQSLFDTGDVSRLEVMRSQRQVGELKGELNLVSNKYRQAAQQEASQVASDYATARFKLEERQNMLDHTQLTAPVTGIVKFLKVNTLGGVLRAGDELMQISPTDSEMLLEIKLNPVDIGQLQIGMPATIKLDAFDFSIYGSLKGQLSYISSDTLTEQDGSQNLTYYRAQIRISAGEFQADNRLAVQALKPGMTASIDIETGRRTVIQYLAKPITRAFSGALNER